LSGLLIAEAASQLTLDLFTLTEAHDLVHRIIGEGRAVAEPTAVNRLIGLCARLPLALRIACTRIAARRALTVTDAVDDLTIDDNPLVELSGTADERSAVQAVFGWSYGQLAPELARAFRLLGMHPGTEFSVPAITALTGTGAPATYRALESLADLHLVEPAGRRRYRLHDLLHAFAAQRAATDESDTARTEATTRITGWYARTALAADRLVFPGLPAVPADVPRAARAADFTGRDDALAWLNTEWVNLQAALRVALDHCLWDAAMCLAGTARFLSLREQSLLDSQVQAQALGLRAARTCGDAAVESYLLASQADTLSQLGRLDEAEAVMAQELALARRLGDGDRQRVALVGLGYVRIQQARWAEARAFYRQALPFAQHGGQTRSEAVIEGNLSRIAAELGQFEISLAHARRERVLRHAAGDQVGQAWAAHDEAMSWQGLGEHDQALDLTLEAIAQYEALTGTDRYRASALCTAATSYQHQGRRELARECLARAVELFTEAGDPRSEVTARRLEEMT
jgi:tetratricopeptide (TPR) repeat protein